MRPGFPEAHPSVGEFGLRDINEGVLALMEERDTYDLYLSKLAPRLQSLAESSAFEPSIHGPSTHIATDQWTIEDSLGYSDYAHAIYRFLTHPQTRPPLTISIQAPWGGGKSSLMRMIQNELDPQALGARPEPKTPGVS